MSWNEMGRLEALIWLAGFGVTAATGYWEILLAVFLLSLGMRTGPPAWSRQGGVRCPKRLRRNR